MPSWRRVFPAFLFDVALASGAPSEPASKPAPWLEEVAHRVDVYGRFSGHLAFTHDGVDFANNGSRFGIKAEQRVTGDVAVFGRGEWRVNLGQGDTAYNLSENPDTGLATIDSTSNQAIGTRLGYVGLRFGRYAALSFGKQWGVYYDVSEWTDRYAVFGAHGSSTYNAGTDGGQTGEGRANDAVIYRFAVGPLRIGAQAQFLDSREAVVDGWGGSLVFDTGMGLRVGTAYSHATLDLEASLPGYDGGPAQALTAGFTFDGAGFMLSSVNTWTKNHEIVGTGAAAVMYDTLGAELLAAYTVDGAFMPYGGFDFAVPRGLDARFVDPDYGTRDLLAGFRWVFDAKGASFVYIEGRTGSTLDATGERAADVVTAGIRLNYSLRRGLGLEPL